jgi:hypothetical protein
VSEAQQLPGGSSGGAHVRRNPFWLIAMRSRGTLEVLTTVLTDGRRVLPVFSFAEEAAIYFLRRDIRPSWQLRPTSAGELVSLLYGPCRKVQLVALDPISDIEADVVNRLVSLERERFVDLLLPRKASVRLSVGAPGATSALHSRRSVSAQTKDAAS